MRKLSEINSISIIPNFEKYMRIPKEWVSRPSFEVYMRCCLNEGIDYIKEGIISTYPPETVVKYIKRKFRLDNRDIEIENKSILIPQNIITTYPEIKDILNMGGYYFSRTHLNNDIFEMRYDKWVTNLGNTKLYHVSPSIYDEKIMSIGLTPRSKNLKFNYPDRIYFFTNDDEIEVDEQFQMLCYMLSKPKHQDFKTNIDKMTNKEIEIELSKIKKFTLFEIDIKSILNSSNPIKLYVDHNSPDDMKFYYTMENIHPKYIKKIKFI